MNFAALPSFLSYAFPGPSRRTCARMVRRAMTIAAMSAMIMASAAAAAQTAHLSEGSKMLTGALRLPVGTAVSAYRKVFFTI